MSDRASIVGLVILIASAMLALPVGAIATASATPELSPDAIGPESEALRANADGDADGLRCPADRHRSDDRSSATVGPPRIVELYPNPTVHGNVGEYLVLETPPETALENWTITDGHTTARLPNETVSGRIALSADPAATEPLTADPVLELDGTLRLAVDGDELSLRNGTTTLDTVAYDRAPLAERWYRSDRAAESDSAADAAARGRWWPRDATCLPVSTFDPEEATAFVLPDSPDVPRETIRNAEDRLLLAGYTFTDEAIAADLVDAADRGVDVAVLLESGPVGGAPEETRTRIERLDAAGIDVRVIGGEGARYRYHHAKYLVADDAVLITTENWKPSGVGGASNRGWGVRVSDGDLADGLAAVFEADFDGWDTEPGPAHVENASFVADDPSPAREFDADHPPTTMPVESAELLLAPDNAEPRLKELLASADDELLIEQAGVDPDVSLLEASIDAARRGVTVRLLLDGSWYVADEHERLAARLDRAAARDDLDLDVRLVDDERWNRFEKIHAKGIVVDRETAVVGSANWNDNSLRENREVLLVLHGEAAAAYYADVFEGDWEREGWSFPIELTLPVVLALAAAAIVGRRYVRFGDEQRAVSEAPSRKRR
ncbi:phospholipase D-like domain-containing protein [Halosolutus gelatinilyticus]|uniref:phospholipase D-like domain-containing protein n=1 Tax=Halosolutus gelatinilyticus TaxID=2931975 RepID=UPI001FF13F4A|nr:phospholipase D-like domain-containing protein [Halosolutus gelatinilyticus]